MITMEVLVMKMTEMSIMNIMMVMVMKVTIRRVIKIMTEAYSTLMAEKTKSVWSLPGSILPVAATVT